MPPTAADSPTNRLPKGIANPAVELWRTPVTIGSTIIIASMRTGVAQRTAHPNFCERVPQPIRKPISAPENSNAITMKLINII